jgi:hypothetical protein
MPKTERKKVPVHEDDVRAIDRLRSPGSREAAFLTEYTGIPIEPGASEARVLHALVVAGRMTAEQGAEEEQDAYRRLAEFLKTDPDHQAWRASRRTRTARRLAQEAQ